MGLIEKLQSLAVILEGKATLHDALAADHEKNREVEPAKYAHRRAASARMYAEVSREAAKVIAGRQSAASKRAKFTPPSLQEVIDYAAGREDMRKWPDADIQSWWNHFESQGWLVGGKAKMISWKAAAANGFRNWQEKSQPTPTRNATGPNGYVPPSDGHF